MKNLILFLTLLTTIAFAQGDLETTNFLVNPGFEFGVARYTSTGSAVLSKTTTTSEIGAGNASGSWDASASGEFLRSDDYPVIAGLEGANCLARGYYRYSGTLGDVVVRVELDSGDALTDDLQLSDTNGVWTYFNLAFQCPSSDSIHLEFESTADAGELFLDSLWLGSDKRQVEISQATIIAEAYYATTASCIWTRNNTALGAFAADSDCPSITVDYSSFSVNTTDDNLPNIVFDYLPPGIYGVTVSGSIGNTATGRQTYAALSDGTNIRGVIGTSDALAVKDAWTLHAVFSYSTGGARTFSVYSGASGDSAQLANEADQRRTTFTVVRYPNDSEIAIQKPETQGWFVDANIGGSANPAVATGAVTTYTEITNANLDLVLNSGSQTAQIPCATGTASTGLTCVSVNETVGIVYTTPRAGFYQACFSFSTDSGDNRTTFQVVETTNSSSAVVTQGNVRVTQGTTDNGHSHHVCGYFNHTSPGLKTLRLMYEQPGATTAKTIYADRDASNGQRDIHVSVLPVTQQFPQAVIYSDSDPTLLSDAAATRAGKFVYHHGTIYNGGNAPTITSTAPSPSIQYGNFIPYQTQDGDWRMRFELNMGHSSDAAFVIAFAGMAFKTGETQVVLIKSGTLVDSLGLISGADNEIDVSYGSAQTVTRVNGDVSLDGKPTWAW